MDNELSYIGEIEIPTHAAGRTIDLAFSNIPFAAAEVDPRLQTGADHETIRILIPGMTTHQERSLGTRYQNINSQPLPARSNWVCKTSRHSRRYRRRTS